MIPEFRTNRPRANTGAASSGFFAFPKLYHLLQPNTGAGFGLFGVVFPSICLAENLTETVPALPSGLGFGVLLVASLLVASLWENPRDGRSPRQRRGGIFHRLLAKLAVGGCYRWFCFYVWLSVSLCNMRKKFGFPPVWLINLSPWCAPDVVRQIGAREYMRRRPEIFGEGRQS